ncbi:MAG TPA: hypothetical protein VM008_17990 [Phycisphaerae bacterium]|nr:hypothetical protein [Phycisphaerae bacterium]
MTSEEFRKAINQGLGRAVLHIRSHSWEPYAEAIENVCLHNTAYDPQCEGSRADYVYEIVRLTGEPERFAKIVAEGLLNAREYSEVEHLFDMAALFAKEGYGGAREAMLKKFGWDEERKDFLGGEQIVNVDGEKGLLLVAEQIGMWMEGHPEYWVDDSLLKGEAEGWRERVLAEGAMASVNVRRYREAMEKYKTEAGRRRRLPEYRNWSYAELRERIVAGTEDVPRGWLYRWGEHASEEAVREAAADLLKEEDEKRLVAYLRIFDRRRYPLDHERLIQLAKGVNEEAAIASCRALRHVKDESVRALAIDMMDAGRGVGDAVEMLVLNYVGGDEQRIEKLLAAQCNDEDFHWCGHAALHLFEANVEAEAVGTMMLIYERGRCSNCRTGAVRVLMGRGVIPEWMVEECLFDSSEEVREAAREYRARS